MSTPASTVERPTVGLNDPALTAQVNALRTIDNRTNWLYLAREYAFLAVVVALTIAFYRGREAWGLSWGWTVPVSVARGRADRRGAASADDAGARGEPLHVVPEPPLE